MKYIGKMLILLGVLAFIYGNRDYIIGFIMENVIKKPDVSFEHKNNYYLDYQFKFVNNVESFSLKNKEDLLNLYFTVINSGVNNFDFYCPEEYENCINDVITLANDPTDLTNINGFIHPFNSFDTIETAYDSYGRVNLKIIRTYTDVEIGLLNRKVDEIIKTQIKDVTDKKEIIKIINDYIINNTKYDKERTDNNIIKYSSNNAYGVLYENYGICSGYTDAMALFLNYYDIPNYKVISENHVWNAVLLDGVWYHLDLTWDDPIMDTGEEVLDHTYFLVTTDELEELDNSQHRFNKKVFIELA